MHSRETVCGDKFATDLPSPDSRYSMCLRHIRIFAYTSFKQQRDLSHVAPKITTDHFKILSTTVSSRIFSRHPRMKNQTRLHQTCLPKWIKNKENIVQRLSIRSTSHNPVGWHGIPFTT